MTAAALCCRGTAVFASAAPLLPFPDTCDYTAAQSCSHEPANHAPTTTLNRLMLFIPFHFGFLNCGLTLAMPAFRTMTNLIKSHLFFCI